MDKNKNNLSKVKIAIIGAGYWGPNLIRNFKNIQSCEIKWICDNKPGRLKYVHQKWPNIPLTDNFEEIIKDRTVDAIVIATPASTHHILGMAALNFGKHIFIEKPLAITSKHAQELVEHAEKKELILATGHIFVYHPAISAMKNIIKQGIIGDLCYADSGRVNLGPPASEVNVIWDLAVHDISILLYLWEKEPIEVRANGNNFLHSILTDVAFLQVRFEDNSIANHHVSWMSPEKVRRFFVAGKQGSLIFDDTSTNKKLKVIDQGIDSRINLKDNEIKELYYKPGNITVPKLPEKEPLHIECQHFLECIQNGNRPKTDGHSGLAVVRVLEAADQSISSGSKPIYLTRSK